MNRSGYMALINGEALKDKIHSKGYTIKRLGSEISRSEKTISRAIHSNKISPSLLGEIASHLGISTEELTGEETSNLNNVIDDFVMRSLAMADVPLEKYKALDERNRRMFDSEMVGSAYSIIKKYF